MNDSLRQFQFFKNLCQLPFIDAIYLYGSRARGNHKERSDIDLAVLCPKASSDDWLQVLDIIEKADTLLKIDCIRFDELDNTDAIKQNILAEKITVFEREPMSIPVWIQNFKDLGEALKRLKEALDAPLDEQRFAIDTSIHRFEFCIELFWKNFKNLVEREGKEALSPKQAISEAYALKWFDDEKIWLNMLKDRNVTSHTYKKVNADAIYQRIKQYYPEMKKIYDRLNEIIKL